MKIKLYNTLSRKKEVFHPIKKNKVGFYHCGPTVYWVQHIGNLRGMFCADIVIRTFKYFGYHTTHVRNYTDVGHLTSDQDEGEDKIEKAARKEKLSPKQIAQKYIEIFEKDTRALNLLEPNHKPRATKHIQQMIAMTKKLLKNGYAYTTDLAIYFDTSKAKRYHQLSRQKKAGQIAGAGKGEISDPRKKHPADFALWFFKAGKHKNALQSWSSPFSSSLVKNGEGFPGWHIECSVMSNKYLGKTIDIHMGGREHIPVHHTNEIAQSEAANQVKFVNYWLHNGHLLLDSQTMSKSKQNIITLSDIAKKGFSPLALRYLFLQAHYRSKQNFTWQAIQSAQKGLDRLIGQRKRLGENQGRINQKYQKEFKQALADDFGINQAFALLQKMIKSNLPEKDKLATFINFDQVIGLNLEKEKGPAIKIPLAVKKLSQQREKARLKKDWLQADRLRQKIQKHGFSVKDTAQGTKIIPEK